MILYELLTGTKPFDGPAVHDIMARVKSAAPRAPRDINPAVARDLETVCLKCLEKDPNRRYATAAALADDLERWLSGEPIEARPISRFERARKWVDRNRWPSAFIGSLVTLVAVLVGLVSALSRANAELKQSKVDLEDSNGNLERAVQKLRDAGIELQNQAKALVYEDQRSKAALRQASELALGRGSALCEDGDPRVGVLWLTRALEFAERAGADDLARLIRTNLASWSARVPLVRAMLPIEGHVFRTQFGPDGTRLLVWLDNFRGVRLWDAVTGEPCGDLTPRLWVPGIGTLRLPVSAVAFGPNDTVLTFAAGRVDYWRARDGAPAAAPLFLDGHGHFGFSADGTRGAVAAYTAEQQLGAGGQAVPKYRVRVFDLNGRVPVGRPFWLGSVTRLAPDGKTLLTIDTDGKTVALWDVDQHKRRPTPLAHDARVQAAEFSPSGKLVWALDEKRRLQFWNHADGTKAHARPMQNQTTGFVLHPDEKTLICPNEGPVFMDDGTRKFAVWDVGGRQHERWLTAESFSTVMRFTPDGRHVVTAERGDRIQLRDYGSHAALGPVFGHFSSTVGHPGYVSHIAFSADGSRMATHDESGRVFVWDTPREPAARTGAASAAGPPTDVRLVARAAGVIATAHDNGDVRLWAEGTALPLGGVLETGGPVSFLYADPRGTELVIGRITTKRHGSVTVWHLPERRRVGGPLPHDGPVTAADLHPATGRLLTVHDRNVHLWDYGAGKHLAKFAHRGGVSRVAFDASGLRALTTAANMVWVWDVPLRTQLGAPYRHTGYVSGAWFGPGPDDVTAVSLPAEGTVPGVARSWTLPSPDADLLPDLARKVQALARFRLDPNGTPQLIPETEWRKDFASYLPQRASAP